MTCTSLQDIHHIRFYNNDVEKRPSPQQPTPPSQNPMTCVTQSAQRHHVALYNDGAINPPFLRKIGRFLGQTEPDEVRRPVNALPYIIEPERFLRQHFKHVLCTSHVKRTGTPCLWR